jgi:hypothetical protein
MHAATLKHLHTSLAKPNLMKSGVLGRLDVSRSPLRSCILVCCKRETMLLPGLLLLPSLLILPALSCFGCCSGS